MNFDIKKPRFIKHAVKSCNGKQVNDLRNIKVTLLSYTPYEQLKTYIPELVTATWNENIEEFRATASLQDIDRIMELFWAGKLIPTAMKSIQVTVLLEGITTHDVTHIIRHSGLAYAADCTGDKYVMNRNLIVPSFLEDMPSEYKDRYLKIMNASYKLYDDICNNESDKVHIQDARLVLPRTLETFYYITGSLADFMRLLTQRIDLQVQPKSDNIIALRIYEALAKVYPLHIDIHRRNTFYCSESSHELSSKWYKPLPQNKTPYTEKMDTVYGNIEDMNGYKQYKQLEDEICNNIEKLTVERALNEKSNH